MSDSRTPQQRYDSFLVAKPPGHPQCFGWAGKIDKYGTAQFSWTDPDGRYRTGSAIRWLWQQYRGSLSADQALRNTCGWSACQRLGHWQILERPRGLTPAERYEARIDRSGGPLACHEWQQKGRDKNGYGILTWREDGRSVTVRAHRFGWELLHGPLQPQEMVLHRCDNPPCQNSEHWFVGSNADNMADMVAKGRQRAISGETHHRARLTDAQVAQARSRYTGERGQIAALAREYGMSQRGMSRLLKGERRQSTVGDRLSANKG